MYYDMEANTINNSTGLGVLYTCRNLYSIMEKLEEFTCKTAFEIKKGNYCETKKVEKKIKERQTHRDQN